MRDYTVEQYCKGDEMVEPKPEEAPINSTSQDKLVPNDVKYVEVCPHCSKHRIAKKKKGLWRCFTCKKNIDQVVSRPTKAKGIRIYDPKLEPISAEQLLKSINNISIKQIDKPEREKPERDKAFLAAWFLTGRRVSEILDLKEKQVSVDTSKGYPILKFEDMIVLKKKPNYKTKNEALQHPKKSLPIHLKNPVEAELAEHLVSYCRTVKHPDQRLFDFTRQRAWQIVKEVLGKKYFPHWIRHSRVTDMVIRKHWNGETITDFMAWSDQRQLGKYTHLDWDKLADLTKE